MKKILMTLALVFCAQMAFCQSFSEVADKFKSLPGAEMITLDKDLLKMAISQTTSNDADKETKQIIDKVDELVLLNIGNPSAATLDTFLKEVRNLKSSYSKLGEEEEDGETMVIFADLDDEGNSKGLIVGKAGKDECMLIYLKGNISVDEMSALSVLK